MIVIVCINEVNSGPPPKNPVRWLIFTRHLRLGKCFLHEQNKWARRAKDEGAGDPGFLRMQNSLPVVYEMMHFVHFSPPLLPRKHLNPLKTPNARAVCFSNAHSPSPPFSGSPRLPPKKNPLKTACGDKLLPELIHLVERHMYCNFIFFFLSRTWFYHTAYYHI